MNNKLEEQEPLTVAALVKQLQILPQNYTVYLNAAGTMVVGITGAEDIGGDYFGQVFLKNFDCDAEVKAADRQALLQRQQSDESLIRELAETLQRVKTKLDTGPTTQSLIMTAWDRARAFIIDMPGASLPREIFESLIEELTEELEAPIQKANERLNKD